MLLGLCYLAFVIGLAVFIRLMVQRRRHVLKNAFANGQSNRRKLVRLIVLLASGAP